MYLVIYKYIIKCSLTCIPKESRKETQIHLGYKMSDQMCPIHQDTFEINQDTQRIHVSFRIYARYTHDTARYSRTQDTYPYPITNHPPKSDTCNKPTRSAGNKLFSSLVRGGGGGRRGGLLLLLGRRALSGKLRCGLNLQSRHDDRAMGEDGRCPSDGDECGNDRWRPVLPTRDELRAGWARGARLA